jgi:UPF0716 family protein affecting phage T7 exclusion
METPATTPLVARAIGGIAFLLGLMALAIFIPAATVHFWQGWLYLATFGACVVAITAWLLLRDPALVERRMHAGPAGETRAIQKVIQVPAGIVLFADVLVAASFWATYRVFRENSFAASTIRVESQQRVISSGPYSYVRHPMYAGAAPMLLAMPLALASWWGLILVIPMMGGLVARILDEERALAAELAGYEEYRRTVRWRLIPMVW